MPNSFTKTRQTATNPVDQAQVMRMKSSRSLKEIVSNQQVLLIVFLIAMIAVFSALNPRFLSLASFGNIAQDWLPAALLATGQTFVIITAGVDLSVGSVMGMSAISAALVGRSMNESGYPVGLTITAAVLAALAVGIFWGLVNGILVAYVRLAPFIATLATMSVVAGGTLVITNGIQIGGNPREVSRIGSTSLLSILTVPVVIGAVAITIAGLVLKFSRFGRWTYGIGSNRFAADAAGIKVKAHIIKVYCLSGAFAALAGIFVYFRLGSGSPTTGLTMELTAIAAVIVGGTNLFGGSGNILGSVLGAFLVTAVISGLILSGVQPNWQQVVIGLLIVFSVVIQQIQMRRRE